LKPSIKNTQVVIIGYSGHAFVVSETLIQAGYEVIGYFDRHKNVKNILKIPFLGFEQNKRDLDRVRGLLVFTAIGNNKTREKVMDFLTKEGFEMPVALSPKANLSGIITMGEGTLICQGACINPFARIGRGVIINTAAVVEHECIVDNYVHIASGAVIGGNVSIGTGSLVGSNAVIKKGLTIGMNVVIGAGSVVLKHVPDNQTVVGNPARSITNEK